MAVALVGKYGVGGALGADLSFTPPAGSADDLLVTVVRTTQAMSAPSGWTPWAGNSALTSVFYRIATASEPAVTFVTAGSGNNQGLMLRFSGVDTANPLADIDAGSATSTTDPIAPSVDAPSANSYLFSAAIQAASTTTTAPSGMTADFSSNADAGNAWVGAGAHQLVPAGPTGSRTWVTNGTGNSAAFNLVINAAPVPAKTGSAAGAYDFAGSATGTRTPKGAATGGFNFAGTATGKRTPKGGASGGFDLAGSAAGKRNPKGSAVGGLELSGSAAGSTDQSGSASGGYTLSGAASGAMQPKGSAVGGLNFLGTATGVKPVEGQHYGSAVGGYALAGSAAGTTEHRGSAAGSLELSGSATGETPPEPEPPNTGYAEGGFSFAGSATGQSEAVDAEEPDLTITLNPAWAAELGDAPFEASLSPSAWAARLEAT